MDKHSFTLVKCTFSSPDIKPTLKSMPILNKFNTSNHGQRGLKLVDIGLMVLEKKVFKFRQCIFTISYLSPLGKGRDPSFALHPRMLCAKFG